MGEREKREKSKCYRFAYVVLFCVLCCSAIGCRSFSNLHFVAVVGMRAMSDATRRCLESRGPHQKKGKASKLKAKGHCQPEASSANDVTMADR